MQELSKKNLLVMKIFVPIFRLFVIMPVVMMFMAFSLNGAIEHGTDRPQYSDGGSISEDYFTEIPGSNVLNGGTTGQGIAEYAPGRLLVKIRSTSKESTAFKPQVVAGIALTGLDSLDVLNTKLRASAIRKTYFGLKNKIKEKELGIDCWYILTFSEESDILALAAVYKKNKHVAEATPD
jgi:hypothetical protein